MYNFVLQYLIRAVQLLIFFQKDNVWKNILLLIPITWWKWGFYSILKIFQTEAMHSAYESQGEMSMLWQTRVMQGVRGTQDVGWKKLLLSLRSIV